MAKKQYTGFGSACVKKTELNKKINAHTEAIYATSAFTFNSSDEAMNIFMDKEDGYIYSRWGNPTIEMAENKIASLEMHGSSLQAKSQMFSSGMAAISSLILACAKQGDVILTQYQLYGTTDELFNKLLPHYGITVIQTNLHDIDGVEKILEENKNIKLLYIETPSNPLLQIFDIKLLSTIAKKYHVKFAVDNTFCTPYTQQPLLLGAYFSINSTTKFLNGHGSGLGGVVTGIDIDFMKNNIWNKVKLLGCNSNAFDAWLIIQGIKTLELRMQRHCENAMKVATYLNDHKAIKKVYYAWLPSHKDVAIAKTQMKTGGSMLSFEIDGGITEAMKLMDALQLCNMVTTLGTVDTLIQHPASMTHVNVLKERRLQYGITDGLLRMSIGIENIEDIIEDINDALMML